MNTAYRQHPLPGAAYTVVRETSYWTVGELTCAALLQGEDGSLVVAEQSAACYHTGPARLYDRDGRYRQAADRVPMTPAAPAPLRFVMDWSTARANLRDEIAALFAG